MTIVATTAAVALDQIHGISMRAVFGGSLVLLCCLIATGLFKNNPRYIHYIFIILIGIIALVSGVLLASALYVIQNPVSIGIWEITL